MLCTVFKAWISSFINLIYPLSCLICKQPLTPLCNKPLCEICWKKIEFIPPPFCPVCGKPLSSVVLAKGGLPAETQNQAFDCQNCQNYSYFFNKAYSVCIYEGIIKECIHLFKYKRKLSLVKPLSGLMIDFAGKFLDTSKIDLIVPVPLHKTKERSREFNQAKLLAYQLSQALNKQLQDKLLIKTRAIVAQASLPKSKRRKNVQGAFKALTDIEHTNILLIDDVLTTGSTVNECAKTLLDAGAKNVDVFTLAST